MHAFAGGWPYRIVGNLVMIAINQSDIDSFLCEHIDLRRIE